MLKTTTKITLGILTITALTTTAVAQETTTTENPADVQDAQTTTAEPAQENTTAVETTPATSSQASGEKVEKIQVTGSLIKRIDVEGPSPVFTIDRDSMDKSGYNSVADVLRDSTVTSFGVSREASGSLTSGAATAGLRGFGPDKILVLLNGQRLAKVGGQNSVDLNLIPFEALERVEILKDGASATYGSDALAGVINFITKKDYDGATVKFRVAVPEEVGGGREDITASWGKNYSSGNVMAIYQYRNNKRIWDRDRDWSRGRISPTGSPGSYRPDRTGGLYSPDPNCPSDRIQGFGGGSVCGFDFTPFSSSLPDVIQHSALLSTNYELNESLSLYATATFTDRMSLWQYAPAPDTFYDPSRGADPASNYLIPNSVNADPRWNLPGVGTDDIEVRYRLVDELGPRASRDGTQAWGTNIGTKGYMADTWEWDYSVNYSNSETESIGHAGYANKRTLQNLIISQTFRPFDPAGTGNVDTARTVSEQRISSSIIQTQFIATGEYGNLGSGVLSGAWGASGSWEDYQEKVDSVTAAGELWGGAGANGQGSRSYQAIFTEVGYGINAWEFQLAGRVDRYSDFGETFNPKFSTRYKPLNFLLLRGSIGTGFKAPALRELYAAQTYGFPNYIDRAGCAAAGGTGNVCRSQQYLTRTGGNRNLTEETSLSYNLGTVVQVNRDFSIGLDYWFTRIKDAIGIDYDDVMLAEQRLGQAALNAKGVQVIRSSGTTGDLLEVIAPNQNLSEQISEGLDFVASYNIKAGPLTITPQINHSHLLKFQEEGFPGLGLVDKLSWAGNPQWKNTSTLSFRYFNNSLRLGARTIAGQFKTNHQVNFHGKKMATYTEYDIHYGYNGPWQGVISFGVKNALGTDRPIDDDNGISPLRTEIYDQIGRLFYMGYSQSF